MIKDAEIAMVHAATYALEYQDKKPGADVEEIIKQFTRDFNYEIKPETKVYSIAAINAILKIKRLKENKEKSNRQLIQVFMKSIPELQRGISEEED